MKNISSEICQICKTTAFKYTCPRCNIVYCSLSCYKSQKHLKCSEEFYKECVQNELSSKATAGTNKDVRKIYEILKRIRDLDAGLEPDDLDRDGLDSEEETYETDCENEGEQNESLEDIDDDGDDIAERLKNIDINDADEVWERLTQAEKEEFKNLLDSGDIIKLIPDFKPWWLKKKDSKIVEITSINDCKEKSFVPIVLDNIPKYSSICSKEPAPCLHYNLWNILAAYSATVRYFNGEHLTNPNVATAYLINLSSTLKYGTNFEDIEDAVLSVEIEALTTGNGATHLMPTTGTPKSLLVEDREQLKTDSRQLMSTLEFLQGDLVAIRARIPYIEGENEVVIASVYLPGDVDSAPTPEVTELVSYCQKPGLERIIGFDANAHIIVWGSKDTDKKGGCLA